MRRHGFFLPFMLGALSMLAVVIGAGWAAPRLLDRARVALGPGAPSPAAVPLPAQAVAAPVEVAAAPTAPAVPLVRIAPTDVPAPLPSAPAPTAESSRAVVTATDGARLLIPVQGVRAENLVDTYDQARGQGRRHDAIDIMAPRGTPVVAAGDGVVMKLFQSVRGGTALYELAPDGRTIYYYAHLDRYAAGMAQGRALRRGDVLGYVGNTGDAGPGNYHLHFEVSTTADPKRYWGGIAQNPYPLLR